MKVARAMMGRTYVFNHPTLGATMTVGLGIVLHFIYFVEFFVGERDEFSLHEITHINDVEGPMSGESASEMVSTAEASTAVTAVTGETSEETDRPGRTSRSLIEERRIMQIIEDEKAYLDDSLTLESIAARLEMTPQKLSAFYSNHFDVPFRTMINNYRVEAVKNYLLENPTATQDVVASECGYKDAASLNRKFKEAAGETSLMWLAKQTKS